MVVTLLEQEVSPAEPTLHPVGISTLCSLPCPISIYVPLPEVSTSLMLPWEMGKI